ncbi:hypothetical protein K402DRAFT_155848 [Aulographum hederae CBS 113979]|uniref:Uncharacterized protein n=1 Tax=Aulographum hederae CBS 113979 TaxID=1176131 RepID=A0A6G1GSR6_9PEZI|nr:hypothetical protein K402DRAFT_155848 [Aulographum hederae CBS 113979]
MDGSAEQALRGSFFCGIQIRTAEGNGPRCLDDGIEEKGGLAYSQDNSNHTIQGIFQKLYSSASHSTPPLLLSGPLIPNHPIAKMQHDNHERGRSEWRVGGEWEGRGAVDGRHACAVVVEGCGGGFERTWVLDAACGRGVAAWGECHFCWCVVVVMVLGLSSGLEEGGGVGVEWA